MTTFISLFAGIGGFDLGFEQAGLECVAQVERDADAAAVLGYRWPGVPRFNDVRDAGRHNLPWANIICGGFPCQDLSVAGARSGLAGARSGLFYEMVRITDELRPDFLVWENVPGLLNSDRGRDFGRVLNALDGIGYCGAWTTLDAQWFGVAQRRQRVFGVFARGDIGAARCAEILSLAARLPWNTPARGKARARVASGTAASASHDSGARCGPAAAEPISFDWQASQAGNPATIADVPGRTRSLKASRTLAVFGGGRSERSVAAALTAHEGRYDFESENLVALSVSQNQRGELRTSETAAQLTTGGGKPGQGYPAVLSVAIRGREGGATAELGGEQATALRASQGGSDKAHVLTVGALGGTGPGGGWRLGADEAAANHATPDSHGVRRLTPRECERLQGFPDDWTRYRADGSEQADSPRYRQCGNAVAVPCARWIGQRIRDVHYEGGAA